MANQSGHSLAAEIRGAVRHWINPSHHRVLSLVPWDVSVKCPWESAKRRNSMGLAGNAKPQVRCPIPASHWPAGTHNPPVGGSSPARPTGIATGHRSFPPRHQAR
jgi:hypothetical protein